MKYLQLICIDPQAAGTPEAAQAMAEHVEPWVRDKDARGVRILGKPLDDPANARTVRVRDGRTLISDGPFADTKEFIAGLDILDCESLDEAIEVAAEHPVSWFHAIELRPFAGELEIPAHLDDERLRQLLIPCIDGIPESDEVEQQLRLDIDAYRELVDARGVRVMGGPLAAASTATTVRVRDGKTLLSDGPFVETKEFMAGIDILSCESFDEALELAGAHPLARFHRVEVRRFVDL